MLIYLEIMKDTVKTAQNSNADYRIDKYQLLLEIHANVLMQKIIFPSEIMLKLALASCMASWQSILFRNM